MENNFIKLAEVPDCFIREFFMRIFIIYDLYHLK